MRRLLAPLPLLLVAACASSSERAGLDEAHLTADLDHRKVVLTAPGPVVDATTVLSQDEALEDIRFFAFYVKHGYAARTYLEESLHVDLDGPLAALEDEIRTRDTWTVNELFDAIASVVSEVVSDSHLTLVLGTATGAVGRFASGQHRWHPYVFADSASAATVDPSSCELPVRTRVLAKQVFRTAAGETEQPVVLSHAALGSVRCAGKTHPLRELLPGGRPLAKAFSERELDPSTYFVRVHTFLAQQAEVRAKFVASGTTARSYRSVVLDLRANGGGNPEIFRDWLVALGAGGTLRMPRNVPLESFASLALLNNFLVSMMAWPGLAPDMRTKYEEKLALIKPFLEADLASGNVRRFVPPNTAQPDIELPLPGTFQGKVTVLVDAMCASACDEAARIAKTLPGFEVVGETNTFGASMTGDPLPLVLPASKLRVNVPTLIYSTPEVNALEGIGIPPSVWMTPETMDALYPAPRP